MQYTKYSIRTKTEAEDLVCAALSEAGIMGFEIEDSVPFTEQELKEIFVDEVPVKQIPQGEAVISFYLEEGSEDLIPAVEEALNRLKETADIGEGRLSSSKSDDADWLNRWKDYFHAFSISLYDGRKICVVPSWEEEEAPEGDMVWHIDPGTAFGTGAHETTQLCIREMGSLVLPGMRVLDLGTGSGILSMAAFYFGADTVTAVDIDPNAEAAVLDNFEKNGLSGRDFRLLIGDVLEGGEILKQIGGDYDVLVANILPPVLIPLVPLMGSFLKEDSRVIFSGILIEKKEQVIQALKEGGYRVMAEKEQGEWCSLTAEAGNASLLR
ncbi:MAG: 50S ribosomal protein L11 methyltransferase [Lachnospiraceae bacterium]|nr:50S ribosomal protein L11 methyltransferase [Lachnospiraceae bacterium]